MHPTAIYQIFLKKNESHKKNHDGRYPKISNFECSRKVTESTDSIDFDISIEPSYIAQEIWQHKGYSKSSDVYSFSMIIYEIMTNKKPQQISKLRKKIMNDVVNKGYRPALDNSVPKFFQKLIKSCWLSDPAKRPTFFDIVYEIRNNFDLFENEVDKDEYMQYVKLIDNQQRIESESESESKHSESDLELELSGSETEFIPKKSFLEKKHKFLNVISHL